ncbi:tyrosine-type recombinase/integrase [Antrihabitans sp. YC3-6]|uniref:Tyrosine-type recombinase/integrase n=1 Tax=Antrihabitans stalagmiti TaxID=2799499 RepID=A0A934U5T6_9NOCA|nr:site-specific integrase [Antrihabitans stalagmiti]MBJ8341223.1 tyrosine-type recombinase/integrase [Antrihabitans stalagmiti]
MKGRVRVAETRRASFGEVEKLPSGRYRARYNGPDGRRYRAPTTFTTKQDARAWLSMQQADIVRKAWAPPGVEKPAAITFGEFADDWMAYRDLADRTRGEYRKLLDHQILPALGLLPIASITYDDIRKWHRKLDAQTPTLRAHAYGLAATIFRSAENDGKIATSPCKIRGAGTAKRVRKIRPATLDELASLTAAMPDQFKALVMLASWCALRFGELTELRRQDVDTTRAVIRVRRGVVRAEGEFRVKTPKTDAGVRDVSIPPHLVPVIDGHLRDHVGSASDSLVFPAKHGGHLAPSTLYRHWYRACEESGRWRPGKAAEAGTPDMTFHDLRHTGAVLAAATGATLAELMARLGHSTPQAAMRYQHAAEGRDAQIAELLSKLAADS